MAAVQRMAYEVRKELPTVERLRVENDDADDDVVTSKASKYAYLFYKAHAKWTCGKEL